MTVPAALTELGGDKLLGPMYDNGGANAFAVLRGIVSRTQNGNPVAALQIGTHGDGGTIVAGDAVVLIAGIDGTTVRKVLVDASGRQISRPMLVYNSGGNNAFAHPRTIGQGTLNSEAVGHLAVGSHADGATFVDSDPVSLIAGTQSGGTTIRRLLTDASGNLKTDTALTFGGSGATAVAVTGTRVALRATLAVREVRIKAHPANANVLYVGGSTVTADTTAATGGYQLSAGQEILIRVADLATVYINGTAGQGCSWLYWT